MPLHLQPYYQREFGYKTGDYPRAERYYEQAITLPVFPRMSDEDINDVTKAVKKVVIHYTKAKRGVVV
jgi:dTDP-4-amino-4,6-dideoxygalactose transaminase